ncbi:hypothetical protein D9M69_184660 [compost metagenome]
MPAISTFLAAKLRITQPSELVPSRSGSQTKFGALMICHSWRDCGLYCSGLMNRQRPNRLCQAVSVVIWMAR